MTKPIITQQEQIIKRLKKGWTTPLDALNECGCMRLAARVFDMRQEGMKVIDQWVEVNGKQFKAYRLVK